MRNSKISFSSLPRYHPQPWSDRNCTNKSLNTVSAKPLIKSNILDQANSNKKTIQKSFDSKNYIPKSKKLTSLNQNSKFGRNPKKQSDAKSAVFKPPNLITPLLKSTHSFIASRQFMKKEFWYIPYLKTRDKQVQLLEKSHAETYNSVVNVANMLKNSKRGHI